MYTLHVIRPQVAPLRGSSRLVTWYARTPFHLELPPAWRICDVGEKSLQINLVHNQELFHSTLL